MNPIQEIADTIKEFECRQALSLTTFEKVIHKKSPEIRRRLVSYFNIEGEEMIEHGYYCDYHDCLKNEIQKNCRFYTDGKTEALMMAYYFSDPKAREAFRKNLLNGLVGNRLTDKRSNPNMKKISMEGLGNRLLDYRMDLVRPYRKYARKPMIALNMIAQLEKQPASEKEKIQQLVKDSLDIMETAGLDASVPYLANRLLPYFYKECSQKYAEINRPEKIKRTKSILHSFAWLLLNQDRSDSMNTIRRGLFPITKQEWRAFCRNYDCC